LINEGKTRTAMKGSTQWKSTLTTRTLQSNYSTNQSGVLRLTKNKNLILASLLVGALVLLSAPVQAAAPFQRTIGGGQLGDTFSIPAFQVPYKTSGARAMART